MKNITQIFTLGEHDLIKNEKTEQKRKAKDIIIHPNYKNGSFDYDFAIIKLDKPVKFTKYVVPVCLPSHKNQNFDSNEGKVAGWGKIYFTQPDADNPKTLRKVE